MRGRRAARQRPQAPQRRCVACKLVKPKAELFRLSAQDGQAVPGKGLPGRGCWVCKDPRCAALAVKSGQIGRALRGKAKPPALDRLLEWILGRGSLDGERGRGLKS